MRRVLFKVTTDFPSSNVKVSLDPNLLVQDLRTLTQRALNDEFGYDGRLHVKSLQTWDGYLLPDQSQLSDLFDGRVTRIHAQVSLANNRDALPSLIPFPAPRQDPSVRKELKITATIPESAVEPTPSQEIAEPAAEMDSSDIMVADSDIGTGDSVEQPTEKSVKDVAPESCHVQEIGDKKAMSDATNDESESVDLGGGVQAGSNGEKKPQSEEMKSEESDSSVQYSYYDEELVEEEKVPPAVPAAASTTATATAAVADAIDSTERQQKKSKAKTRHGYPLGIIGNPFTWMKSMKRRVLARKRPSLIYNPAGRKDRTKEVSEASCGANCIEEEATAALQSQGNSGTLQLLCESRAECEVIVECGSQVGAQAPAQPTTVFAIPAGLRARAARGPNLINGRYVCPIPGCERSYLRVTSWSRHFATVHRNGSLPNSLIF